MTRRLLAFTFACILSPALASHATAQDIVLRASDFTNIHGNWALGSDASAADGHYLGSNDNGSSSTNAPPAPPADYFEAVFDAPADTPFHLWVRLRASNDSKYNDSVWVQYSDALSGDGQAIYGLGGDTALVVNLARCSGCDVSAWGWQDGAYWLSQTSTVRFAASGTHRLRVQAREDGVQIDQVVLSRSQYLFQSPGAFTDDTAIVPSTGPSTASPSTVGTGTASSTAGTASSSTISASSSTLSVSGTLSPYLGSPVSLPGHIKAENFDNGGEGVSYHDTTPGNAGGLFRQTDVDIEACSSGGYDIGWTAAGEWLNYAVTAPTAGSYTVQLRVSSPGGASLHVGFNGPSNVWKTVSVPATGGWQSWTTVSVSATLGAGAQTMTLLFDTGGVNIDYVDVVSGSTATPTPAPIPTPTPSTVTGGSAITVVAWNIQVNDSGAAHATRAIDYLMAMTPQPQVVVLEEAHLALYGTYISELQARSGRTWQGVFRTHCAPGAWTGSTCTATQEEGVAVFSSLPVVGSGTTFLPGADQWHSARGAARLAVSAGGIVTQVYAVHLPITASARATAMARLKSYSSNYSAPQLAAGDFNADQDQIDPGMSPNFVDSWTQVGSGRGFTAFTPSPSMKLDYWLQDAGGRARPQWSVVVTTPGSFSDHFPVITSYSIR